MKLKLLISDSELCGTRRYYTTEMRLQFLVPLLLTLTALLLTEARPRPRHCAPDPAPAPACRLGQETDECGNTQCLKGPGQICGGR